MSHATFDSTALVPRAPAKGSSLHRHFGDARAGLYGPHALLLQVMHPVIDAGVLQHSQFKTEPFKRFYTTMKSMATLVYGGAEGSAAECRRLRNLHKTIRGIDKDGQRYHSLDPEAWTWVYATLVKGSIDAQQRYGFPFESDVLDEYYREARELGMLLGVRPQDLPEDWSGFEKYCATMIETKLVATESARDVLAFLGNLPRPFFVPKVLWRAATWPIAWFIRFITVATLPTNVRTKLELTWTDGQEDLYLWMVAAGKIVSFFTPQFFFTFGTRVAGFVYGRMLLRQERRQMAAGGGASDAAVDRPRLPGPPEA